MRYDEDWSFLKDPSRRTEPLDRLKYVSLGKSDWYLSIGGEARLRYEYYTRYQFGAGPQDDNGYFLQRYLLHSDWHLGKRARAFAQVQSGIGVWRNGGPRLTDDDRLEIHQAFADLNFGDEKGLVTIRIGRQEMEFGAGRLVTAGEGLNVRRSFDGVRFIYHTPRWTINTGVIKLAEVERGLFNDFPDSSQTFWGLGATPRRSKPRLAFAPYYMGMDRKLGRFDQGTGREVRHNVGGRLFGSVGRFEYTDELILQFGRFNSRIGPGRILAWAVATDTSYGFPNAALQPRISLRADATSGDKDPLDRRLESFNPFFPGTAYSDIIGLVGATNSLALGPSLRLKPTGGLLITSTAGFFWRQSTREGIYGVTVSPLRTGQLSNARYIGALPSIKVEWQLTRHWFYTFTYGHFFTNRFLRETPPGESTNYLTTWFRFRF